MLTERPYLRGDYQREKTSALTWLLSATVAGFVLQVLFGAKWFGGAGADLESLLGLSVEGLGHARLWTLLTYPFLHSTDFIFHVIGNGLLLYFLGRELIPMLGTPRFLGLYGAATVVGGIAWASVHWRFGHGELVGATAAVSALFIVFACFFPNQRLNFLLLFVLPISVKPKHLAFAFAGFDLLAFALYELPGVPLPFDWTVASSAHLGGMLTGLFYFRFMHDAPWFNRQDRAEIELPRWLRRRPSHTPTPSPAAATPPAPQPQPADIRAEIDRILDKINSHGIASLTPQERRLLEDAKKVLHPR